MMEIWKDIKGYEGLYKASDKGRIMNHKRGKVNGLFLNKKTGYMNCVLFRDGKPKSFLAHRVTAITFINNSENLPEVNHKNGVKTDNRAENLEWCTSSQNQIHAYSNGFQKGGEFHPSAVLTVDLVKQIRAKYVPFLYSIPKLAREFSMSNGAIASIIYKRTWKNI